MSARQSGLEAALAFDGHKGDESIDSRGRFTLFNDAMGARGNEKAKDKHQDAKHRDLDHLFMPRQARKRVLEGPCSWKPNRIWAPSISVRDSSSAVLVFSSTDALMSFRRRHRSPSVTSLPQTGGPAWRERPFPNRPTSGSPRMLLV